MIPFLVISVLLVWYSGKKAREYHVPVARVRIMAALLCLTAFLVGKGFIYVCTLLISEIRDIPMKELNFDMISDILILILVGAVAAQFWHMLKNAPRSEEKPQIDTD